MSYQSVNCIDGRHAECAWIGICGDLCTCSCHSQVMSNQDLSRFVLTNVTKRISYEEAAIEVMDCMCSAPICWDCKKPVHLQPVASIENAIDILRICGCSTAGLHIYAKCPKKAVSP